MGNNQSHEPNNNRGHEHHHRHSNATTSTGKQTVHHQMTPDPRFVQAFHSLRGGGNNGTIGLEQTKAKMGPLLGALLFAYLSGGAREITEKQFLGHAKALAEVTSEQIVGLIMPPQRLLEVCLEADGISIKTEDERNFEQTLLQHMTSNGNDAKAMIGWISEHCVRMCQSTTLKIHSMFTGHQTPCAKVHSELLNPVQMFFLRKALPTMVFYPNPAHADLHTSSKDDWILIYGSSRDGLSINRFETKVYDYKGPTVAVICLTSHETYVLVADEEWRHGLKPFGGPYSTLYQLRPKFNHFERPHPAIYCNFKSRCSNLGISYARIPLINDDMSNVQGLEVWGCAGHKALQDQNVQKERQKAQVERNAKVPLPGKWDADKAILEMAGHTFSNERRD